MGFKKKRFKPVMIENYIPTFCKCGNGMAVQIIEDEIKFCFCSNHYCENNKKRFHVPIKELEEFTEEENKTFSDKYSNVTPIK